MTAPKFALPIGHEIGGYQIIRYVGSGGFGIVYEGANPVTGERVAIKEYFQRDMVSREGSTVVLHDDRQMELHRAVLARFEQTTALQFNFNHPNILKVRNYIQRSNTGFMITDFVDGKSLADHLRDLGGHFASDQDFRLVMEQVLGAVGYVHRKGHLHRDISPENILIDQFGKPVLIDFGSLKRDMSSQGSSVIFHRPEYSPPEQRDRNLPEQFYTDIFALAGTMYYALAGVPPLASDRRSASFVYNRPDPYMPIEQAAKIACPPEVFGAINQALRLATTERPQTVEEFAAALRWRPNYGDAEKPSDVAGLGAVGSGGRWDADGTAGVTIPITPDVEFARGRREAGGVGASAGASDQGSGGRGGGAIGSGASGSGAGGSGASGSGDGGSGEVGPGGGGGGYSPPPLQPPSQPAGERTSSFPWRTYGAVAVVLLAIVGLLWFVSRPDGGVASSTAPRAPVQPSSQAAVAPASSPVTPRADVARTQVYTPPQIQPAPQIQPLQVQPPPQVQPAPPVVAQRPPPPPPPRELLPDGFYTGERGYFSPNGTECRPKYQFTAEIRGGVISFESDDFRWEGTVDQVSGQLEISNDNIRRVRDGKLSRRGLSVAGPYNNAALTSGSCGSGFLRIFR